MGFKKYVPKPRTVEQIVEEKIQVLRDFYIVDDRNEEEIRTLLTDAVNAEPNRDPDFIVDKVAKNLIADKLA